MNEGNASNSNSAALAPEQYMVLTKDPLLLLLAKFRQEVTKSTSGGGNADFTSHLQALVEKLQSLSTESSKYRAIVDHLFSSQKDPQNLESLLDNVMKIYLTATEVAFLDQEFKIQPNYTNLLPIINNKQHHKIYALGVTGKTKSGKTTIIKELLQLPEDSNFPPVAKEKQKEPTSCDVHLYPGLLQHDPTLDTELEWVKSELERNGRTPFVVSHPPDQHIFYVDYEGEGAQHIPKDINQHRSMPLQLDKKSLYKFLVDRKQAVASILPRLAYFSSNLMIHVCRSFQDDTYQEDVLKFCLSATSKVTRDPPILILVCNQCPEKEAVWDCKECTQDYFLDTPHFETVSAHFAAVFCICIPSKEYQPQMYTKQMIKLQNIIGLCLMYSEPLIDDEWAWAFLRAIQQWDSKLMYTKLHEEFKALEYIEAERAKSFFLAYYTTISPKEYMRMESVAIRFLAASTVSVIKKEVLSLTKANGSIKDVHSVADTLLKCAVDGTESAEYSHLLADVKSLVNKKLSESHISFAPFYEHLTSLAPCDEKHPSLKTKDKEDIVCCKSFKDHGNPPVHCSDAVRLPYESEDSIWKKVLKFFGKKFPKAWNGTPRLSLRPVINNRENTFRLLVNSMDVLMKCNTAELIVERLCIFKQAITTEDNTVIFKQTDQTRLCPVCFETAADLELEPCGHRFCGECISVMHSTAENEEKEYLKSKLFPDLFLLQNHCIACKAPIKEVRSTFDKTIVSNIKRLGQALPVIEPTFIEKNDLQVDKVIGRGAYGTVFAGKWNGKDVAIKELFIISEDSRKVFFREAAVISLLNHPNLMSCYGICKQPISDTDLESYGLVFELMDESLYQVIQRQAQWPNWKLILDISYQIASGLSYIHKCGFIHRDIKASNILRHKDTFKIGDFGLVRDAAANNLTRRPAPHRNTEAPEIFEGIFDNKTDVFYFGKMMHVMCDPKLIRENWVSVQIPKDIGALVDECTAPNLVDRPNSYQLVERLKVLLATYSQNNC